jgi:hypothetical protein
MGDQDLVQARREQHVAGKQDEGHREGEPCRPRVPLPPQTVRDLDPPTEGRERQEEAGQRGQDSDEGRRQVVERLAATAERNDLGQEVREGEEHRDSSEDPPETGEEREELSQLVEERLSLRHVAPWDDWCDEHIAEATPRLLRRRPSSARPGDAVGECRSCPATRTAVGTLTAPGDERIRRQPTT